MEEGPFHPVLKKSGYRVETLKIKNKLQSLTEYYKFLKHEKQKFDVIHIHRESLSLYFALIAKLCGIKGVCRTVHNNFDFKGFLRVRRIITRFFMRRLGVAFIYISDSVAETEKKVLFNPGKDLVYNWYDSKRYSYTDELQKQKCREALGLNEGFYVISVGNCSEIKNHKAILEAMSELKAIEDLYYLHIGEESDDKERKLAEYYGISDKVRFIGYEDPTKYLKAADLYIMPSQSEGLSIAALEAGGIGLPLLLASVKGLNDLRKLCLDHVYYFELNTKELKHGIQKVYTMKKTGLLKNSKEQSLKLEKYYSVQRGVEAYKQIYRRCCKLN